MSVRKVKEYSGFELVFGNLAIIVWIALSALACGIFYFLAGIGYFAFLAFLIFFEIGKHGCVTCYYCKTCTIGMGKLPEFFFKPDGTANVNRKAQRIFLLVFVLLSFVPLAMTAISLIQEPVFFKVAVLTAILGFSIYSGFIRRKILLT